MILIAVRARWNRSKVIGCLLCLCLFLIACAQDSDGIAGDPDSALRGEQVFNDNCGDCHSGGRAPTLSEIKSLSSSDRRDRIRNHPISGQIPQRLPAAQLSDVIVFFEAE